jgi:hypothetical protein
VEQGCELQRSCGGIPPESGSPTASEKEKQEQKKGKSQVSFPPKIEVKFETEKQI